ncbi:UDP-N-acetylmuramoyl-tripeptide--D-alanyl-D-alanine ligase [Nitrincola sp. MINF-07-Sa-05]|uniref:UDP-N-acetylmuramoyl-tripeptide--D-alanyl-D- alanine ligase n=1 Tax=Nitrincola salilacus TaxID=3400273 RepID=UPI003917FDA9
MIGDWTLSTLAQALNASHIGPDVECLRVCTDSRQIQSGDLFVALRGPSFDGHAFIAEVRDKGAVAAVTDHQIDDALPQLIVEDTLKALGQAGALNRSRFSGQVFAVTGSSGKTTVKEMLASMLAVRGRVLATRGNLNNLIGAPLTLLSLTDQHDSAVVELGASEVGEIAATVVMTRPAVAILNNALGAHIEGFGSLEAIVRAKGEIFDALPADGAGIVNLDDPHAAVWLKKLQGLNRRAVTFGVNNPAADMSAENLHQEASGNFSFDLCWQQQRLNITLSLLGRHNVANATAASAAWVAAGLPFEQIKEGLEACAAVNGRMKPIRLASGALLIDDSYNANPDAMRAAIDLLASRPGKRILIAGDMAELGPDAEQLHAATGEYAAAAGLDLVLTTGKLTRDLQRAANAGGAAAEHLESCEEIVKRLKTELNDSVTLLVKGSRSAGMERVVNALKDGEN